MGSAASKQAKTASSAALRRQYPKQPSSATTQPSTAANQQQKAQPPEREDLAKASTTKSEAIDLDGRDPDFAASLRSIGPVTPTPTLSNSSTFSSSLSPLAPSPSNNPTLLTLSARATLSRAATQELNSLGRASARGPAPPGGGGGGREFLDAVTIKQIIAMRDRQGLAPDVIERHMGLKAGVMQRLGGKGVVGEAR